MSRMTHDGAGQRLGLALAVASAASFGLSGALARGLLDRGWSPGAVVLARMSIGAIVVAPLAVRDLRGRWRAVARHWPRVAFYGLVPIALAQFAYFSAVARMDVGPALLIEYTAPATVVVWLWLRRGEVPSRLTVAGAVVCALGLVLVLDLVAGPSLNPVGVGWALLAMVGAATYFLISADGIDEMPAIGLAACGLVVGALALGVVGALGVLPMRASTAAPRYASVAVPFWLALLALGGVTAGVAYCTGIGALRRLGSRVGSFVALLEVLSGVVFAWLLLGQVPGPLQILGGALLMAGVVVVKLGERSPAPGVPLTSEPRPGEGDATEFHLRGLGCITPHQPDGAGCDGAAHADGVRGST